VSAARPFPRLPRAEFEALIIDALLDLPVFFQEQLQNIEVLVESWPQHADRRTAGVESGALLLGLYHGVPLTERTSGYQLVTPDTITLYQGPIELVCGGDFERIRAQVKRTVIHEIAHHFGISDDRLRELGAY
jgi:predicted Zn-dependent protease with MMP-like domain